MRESRAGIAFATFCVLALLNTAATCQTHTVRDIEGCAVAGVLAAGMDCAHTRTDEVRSMNLDETIEFLEPQEAKDGKPERGGAICFSADDVAKNKSDLEIICRLLGDRCSYEVKQEIQKSGERLRSLQQKSLEKRKQKKRGKK